MDGAEPEQHTRARAPQCFARHRVIVFGVFVRFLAAFPRGHLGRICSGYFEQGGQGVGLKLQVNIGNQHKLVLALGEVSVVASTVTNVATLFKQDGFELSAVSLLNLQKILHGGIGGAVVAKVQRNLVQG